MPDRLYLRPDPIWAWLYDTFGSLDDDFHDLLEFPEFDLNGEVDPDDLVVTVAHAGGLNTGVVMFWGVAPPGQPARWPVTTVESEKITEDERWLEWLASERCVIPVCGYRATTHPDAGPRSRIRLATGEAIGLAALYAARSDQVWGSDLGFAILTTAAGDDRAPTSRRQPVIVPPEHITRWLDPEIADPGLLQDLLRPLPAGSLLIESEDQAESAWDTARAPGREAS